MMARRSGFGGVAMAGGVIALGSALLLAGAFGYQLFGGLAPCELCVWQRWAHAGALAGGLAAVVMPRAVGRIALALGLLALLAGVGVAIFHVGVEQGWWLGLESCTGVGAPATSVEDMLSRIETAPVVRCGDIPWSFLGLSMAAWNAVTSTVLAAVAVVVALRRR